jgi:hypothetical protein
VRLLGQRPHRPQVLTLHHGATASHVPDPKRWVGTVRRECLDRLLILGRRQLEHVLRVYLTHYNRQRPHRALDPKPPDSTTRPPLATAATPPAQVNRRDLLGGLIHDYELAAA